VTRISHAAAQRRNGATEKHLRRAAVPLREKYLMNTQIMKEIP